MTDREAEKWLEAKTADLTEHFDAVQILATYTDQDGTHCVKRGSGNWYARQGMAHEFIGSDQAQEIARQIKLTQE